MAKSERQKKVDEILKALWTEIQDDIKDFIEGGGDPNEENCDDWTNVTMFLENRTDELLALCLEGEAKVYEGKLSLTDIDRNKIIREMDGSCLSESAKAGIRRMLKA